ncbi:MAG: hypothetical protein WA945_09610 [Arcobacteraceae bacterium]
MTIAFEEIECPNCGKQIKMTYKGSQLVLSHKTDLRSVGKSTPTPFINSCKYCKYTFFDENVELDKKLLSEYIQSDEYLNIFKKYKSIKNFLIIYHIYKNQKQEAKKLNLALLYTYYISNDLDDLKFLVENYKIFLETNTEITGDTLFANMLIGEYHRRIGDFITAKPIFEKIKIMNNDANSSFVSMCINMTNFQLKLIADKNCKLEIYDEKSNRIEIF